MTIRMETAALVKDLYRMAHMQAALGKDDLELAIDWPVLRGRAEIVLIREGVVLPELPDPPEQSHE